MRFSTIVLKNAIRRPLRSILTALAIAVAVGTVVALVGISYGFERTFLDLYRGSGIGLIVVRAGSKQRMTSTLDERLADKIRALPGVRDVFGGLVDTVSFNDLGLYGVLVQGWMPETLAFDHLRLISGRALRRDDGKAVMLGTILAKNLGKGVGDTLSVYEGEDFRVIGVYRSSNVFEEGAMVVPLAQLQRLMQRQGQVTGLSVILDRSADQATLERVRRQVEALAPALHAMTTDEHVKSLTEIQLAKAMSWLTSTVALVLGTFGVMNTMIMAVHERTKEIGILRAIGWRRRRVAGLILLESVILSLVGAILGGVGAGLLLRLLTFVPTVNGLIDGRVPPIVLAYGLAIALLVGLCGGLLPAYRASRMLPTEALGYE
ncbi:MAG: ABC transporter permease [Isosphaeraceae bacterium]